MPADSPLHNAGPDRQRAVYVNGLAGQTARVPVAPEALETHACEHMSAEAFAYVAGSAGAERTADANRSAFGRHRIVPRVLSGTAERDLARTLLGVSMPAPTGSW